MCRAANAWDKLFIIATPPCPSLMPLPTPIRHPWLLLAERAAILLETFAASRHARTPDDRRVTGNIGERAAYFHLRRHGYLIVARQWRAPNRNGEVDLIGWDGETLCFIEVKTRRQRDRFGAAYALNPAKRKAVRDMARAYIVGLPWRGDQEPKPATRFDLVTVDLTAKPYGVHLHRGAF